MLLVNWETASRKIQVILGKKSRMSFQWNAMSAQELILSRLRKLVFHFQYRVSEIILKNPDIHFVFCRHWVTCWGEECVGGAAVCCFAAGQG